MTSVGSVEQARLLKDQLHSLLRSAGFELRKWANSHTFVLSALEPSHYSTSMLSFDSKEDNFLKVLLGLCWYARTDHFGFQVHSLKQSCSERIILSEVARMFNPFLAPLTFTAKNLI